LRAGLAAAGAFQTYLPWPPPPAAEPPPEAATEADEEAVAPVPAEREVDTLDTELAIVPE
jgi:hypothetical protein